MSTDAPEKSKNVELLKNKLFVNLKDITEASKGDMNLYSPSKNIRIQVVNKQKVVKGDYTKFETVIERLQPSVAVFISFVDDIPLRIKTYILNEKPVLEIHANFSDVNERFIDMLANQEDISELESKTLSLENSKKKPKESYIESYGTSTKDFDEYCKSVPISKIEYEKAKAKWSESMKQFENRTKFIEHIKQLRNPTVQQQPVAKQQQAPTPAPATAAQAASPSDDGSDSEQTEQQFNEYIKTTPISKITKKEIKARFGNLSDSITHMNKTGDDFKSAIKKLKESLSK